MHGVDERAVTAGEWSGWSRTMRRRAWGILAIVPLVLVPYGAIAAMLIVSLRSFRSAGVRAAISTNSLGWTLAAVLIVGAALVLAITATMIVAALRLRRLAVLVPAQDGAVCFVCRTAHAAGPARSPCSRCGVHVSGDELRRYWTQTIASPLWAAQWAGRRLAMSGRGWRRRWAASWRWFRHHPVAAAMLPTVGGLAIVVLAMTVTGGPFLRRMVVDQPVFAAIILGQFVVMAAVGVPMRRRMLRAMYNRDLRCATCGYGRRRGAHPPPRCPECGAEWLAAGGTAHGGRWSAPKWAAACSIGLVVLMLAVTLGPRLVRRATVAFGPRQPVAALVANLRAGIPASPGSPAGGASPSGFAAQYAAQEAIVEALRDRSLAESERRDALTALLDLRAAGQAIAPGIHEFINDAVVDGSMPADLLRRHLAEAVVATIDAPAAGAVGEPIELRVDAMGRASSSPGGGGVQVVFGGWLVGDDPAPREPGRFAVACTKFGRREGHTLGISAPRLSFTPSAPGAVRVRAVLWILAGSSDRARIAFGDDGAPILPPEVVSIERLEIERTIEVAAASAPS